MLYINSVDNSMTKLHGSIYPKCDTDADPVLALPIYLMQ